MLGGAKGQKAFTLIEILIAVGIIGVLLALLIPALVSAKRQAKSVSCLSNLHQLGLAVELYEQDNGEMLPPLVPRADIFFKQDNKRSFLDPLAPYGMTTDLYHCPDAITSDRDVPERSDYEMRFVYYMRRLDRSGTDIWQPTLDSSSVIAYCKYHHGHLLTVNGHYEGQGMFNILRHDGSVSRVPVSSVKSVPWTGEFAKIYDTSLDVPDVFPNETWPPTLNKIGVNRF